MGFLETTIHPTGSSPLLALANLISAYANRYSKIDLKEEGSSSIISRINTAFEQADLD